MAAKNPNIHIEFNGKSITDKELIAIAKEHKAVDAYLKMEDGGVYCVNKDGETTFVNI